jgi:ribonuclease HII
VERQTDTRRRRRRPPATPSTRSDRRPSPWPDDRLERTLTDEGFGLVAGLDEVGRGAWAGPVSVGVVVFAEETAAPEGVRDSKLLTEDQREALFPLVTQWCAGWAVGHAGAGECDRLGMTAALRLAARRALGGLAFPPRVVVMDGLFDYVTEPGGVTEPTGPDHPAPGAVSAPEILTVVKGDATCTSIAAASIVAKVTRDRLMRSLSTSFPGFDFDRNKGYPSPAHRTALAGFGLTSMHRRSWSYVDDMVFH